ncbi:3 beta-hydroxysteroid dehydrogenase/Delta 5--_4-isomerase [BD1-7 clade bacterium]|uniref:3 beta-hydroxysteroid dehydrogenase/Delta 5-->4-isomerase n=1 Tax=BD1-7 clade bacterium TaxID=2029982 RepID=A0A5S9QKW5_9GAMM|nr:3 beta-hydroxysteroid dehydrogenase/Delta 5-->4-isomerase [BD1-7 clade bacterium]CAA0120538.1 3 beta-hydroxysteroid dehydrogenase/Delta 5-->4-isomerase [BD1-7 clade bacterium]
MNSVTRDPAKIVEDLGTCLVTGGSGFVGKNFVKTLLDKGYKVKSFDIVPSDLEHENLEIVQGNICDSALVENIVEGVNTVFHTAAIIGLKGGRAVSKEYRDQSYAINVDGTKNLLRALQKAGGKRFVYTASNSVIIEAKNIENATEETPYTNRFNDLYTETKVVAEKWVLEQNGQEGVLTCSVRPSGIWGPGDQTMFKMFFEQIIAGLMLARVGDGTAKLDNSYVHNLIHGQILAAQHLTDGGTSPGEAYFINDGEPMNMFDFAEDVIVACGRKMPKYWAPAWLVKGVMTIWQELHFRLNFPEPPLPPLAIERIAFSNYFSIEKARKDLGYEPLYTTKEALDECIPFYRELFEKMKEEAGK